MSVESVPDERGDGMPVIRREPRVFVLYPGHVPGTWEVDGAHAPDADLTSTLGVLKRLAVTLPILKLTITDDPRVGGAWPTVESLVEEFVAAPPAPPLGATDA